MSFKPVIFFVSECDIQDKHNLDLLKLKGYDIHVSGTLKSRNKGRILAYVKDGCGVTRREELEHSNNDILVFNFGQILIAGVYAGFKTYANETNISNFQRLLDNLSCVAEKSLKRELIIGGDFNADPSRDCSKFKLLDIWQTDQALDQLVNEVTRIRAVDNTVQMSTIDLVFVGDVPGVEVQVKPTEVSDHHLVITQIPKPKSNAVKFEKKIIVDWRNYDQQKMNDLITTNLGTEFSERIETCDRDITIAVVSAMNRVMPKRVIHLRRDNDVVNYHIEAAKKKRDRKLKMARKTGNPVIMNEVKSLNAAIKRIVKSERKRLLKNKMKNSSPATFWSTVNGLLGRSSTGDDLVLINESGLECRDECAAQMFADFFKGKVDKLLARNQLDDEVLMPSYQPMQAFTEEEIERALSSFKPKKSSGPDEVPLLVMKTCYESMKPAIIHLFRLFTNKGVIPQSWKCARVKPIFKKGDKTRVDNYRPISNLNSISKLFERCLLNRLSSKDIDGVNQHGFRPSHSTITAAIEIQSCLANSV